mmetsp:Transcript_86472/g.135347  ORF Transcript_86472/g.135347 Transcript_86472/m.135347 type:complete len:152 (+) Transcript_86472:1-456(+)
MASHMFWMSRGEMVYKCKGKRSAKVFDGDWACEGSLWTYWATRGDLKSNAESQVITLEANVFVNALKTNEVMLAMMSSYAELFLEWLNGIDQDELTDVTFAHKGGLRQAQKLVEEITSLTQKRVREDDEAAEMKERKLAQKREKEKFRAIK